MAYTEFIVSTTNTATGDANPALQTYHLDTVRTATEAETAAQLIAFTCYGSKAANTSVANITSRESTADGAVPVAFPTTEYAALAAANSDLPSMDHYGQTFGSGNLAPVGVGITLGLYSAFPGRHTTGRTYCPFVNSGAITASGLVGASQRSTLENAYRIYLRGVDLGVIPPVANLHPVVFSKMGSSQVNIITPRASTLPCRLKTRTR